MKRRNEPKSLPRRSAQVARETKIARLTRELTESLQQQTATTDVLQVISRSTFDLQAVLDTLIGSAIELCQATSGVIWLRKAEQFRLAAHVNAPEEWVEAARDLAIMPVADAVTVTGVAAFTGDVINVEDVLSDPRFSGFTAHRLGDYRGALAVPMSRESEVVGVITLTRAEARRFTERQVALIRTFADQAVIAIENVRLFEAEQQRSRELTESLERQTATAKVLQVISSSTFDLQTVLDTLVESAARLCAADKGVIFKRDGDLYRLVTNYGFSTEAMHYAAAHPLQPGRDSATGRAALEGRAIHIPDVLADPEYRQTGYQEAFKYRSNLAVPLLREGTTIGVFVLTRDEVNPFTDKQIELGSRLIKSTIQGLQPDRLRTGNFGPACRSGLRCA